MSFEMLNWQTKHGTVFDPLANWDKSDAIFSFSCVSLGICDVSSGYLKETRRFVCQVNQESTISPKWIVATVSDNNCELKLSKQLTLVCGNSINGTRKAKENNRQENILYDVNGRSA